jgi:hypothetical protein
MSTTLYVNNQKFLELLKEYSKTHDRKTYNEIGKIFLKIAQNILNRPSFINYSTDRHQDMISSACLLMVKYMKNFDVKQYNPFAYFSQICFMAFLQYLNDQNKRDAVFVSLEKLYGHLSLKNLTTDLYE